MRTWVGCPDRLNQNGLFLLGPTLMEFGTPEQQRFLPAMASAEHIWAQGWSEPDAGSDMASIRTRATRDGDDWVVTGQKTWSTRAAFADWMFALVRTDPDSERHRGLSFVLVPLDADGVEVRPIRQLNGEPGFAEVFLDQVRVPVADNTVGAVSRGWHVTMATAGFERGVSLRSPGRFNAAARRLVALAESRGEALSPPCGCSARGPRWQPTPRTRSTAERGWTGSCSRCPGPSTPAPTRSSATSSPNACWACRAADRPPRPPRRAKDLPWTSDPPTTSSC